MKKQKGGFQKIIGFSMVCCMLTNLAVPVSFAEETKFEVTYDHGYYGQTVTNLCLKHVSLIR